MNEGMAVEIKPAAGVGKGRPVAFLGPEHLAQERDHRVGIARMNIDMVQARHVSSLSLPADKLTREGRRPKPPWAETENGGLQKFFMS